MADEPLDGGSEIERMFGDEASPATVETPAQEPIQQQEPVQPTAPATTEQPRGPDGKFASKEAKAVPPAPAAVAPPAPSKGIDPEQFKGYLDEREKRQKLERELEDARKQLEVRNTPPQPQAVPSIYEDPDAYAAYVAEQSQRAAVAARFDTSELVARGAHGDDAVEAAMQWGMEKSQASRSFAAEYYGQKNPIDWIIKQHKREQTVKDIGDDPDAYVRRRAAELGLIASTEPVQPATAASPQSTSQTPPPPAPPRSIIHAPSAGGPASPASGDAFDAMFGKR